MTAINILIAVLGGGITVMVAAAMIFLTPRGVEAHVETSPEQRRPLPEPAVGRDAEVVPPR
jgi:hypothetical protein